VDADHRGSVTLVRHHHRHSGRQWQGLRGGRCPRASDCDARISKKFTPKSAAQMFKNGMRPAHPGEVLREDFLKPLGMSANALATALSVPAPRINDVVRERRGISADTAMRLARYFGGDARSWLNLQAAYDLRVAEISSATRIARGFARCRLSGRGCTKEKRVLYSNRLRHCRRSRRAMS